MNAIKLECSIVLRLALLREWLSNLILPIWGIRLDVRTFYGLWGKSLVGVCRHMLSIPSEHPWVVVNIMWLYPTIAPLSVRSQLVQSRGLEKL